MDCSLHLGTERDHNMGETTLNQPPAPEQLLVRQFKAFYEHFSYEQLGQLDEIYTQDVEFVDPVHSIQGLLGLKNYLRKMAKRLRYYKMDYMSTVIEGDSAYVSWVMQIGHPAIKKGAVISVRGMSHIRFTSKIYYHEDAYDLGALLYEHMPLLGCIIRRIKVAMAAQGKG